MGGMAELYRAKITGAEGFEKLIAIKRVLPHLVVEKDLVNSFIDEAKLAAYLQHQNIVQIYDFGNMEGAYFIAMEYLFGKDLKQIISQSKKNNLSLGMDNILYITSQVCAGLNYAHNLKDFHKKPLNIIHRDIGPQNIFVTYDGQVKIIDFSIAKAAIQDTTTQVGSIKGKVAYMSPEQARGEQIDFRSDIFSLGIVLYEMTTGERMYKGNTFEAYAKAREAEFEPLEQFNIILPRKLHRILNNALTKDRGYRYKSAAQMQSDINSLLSDLSFQPGDRALSKYMNKLFREEAEAEEQAMQEAALINNIIPYGEGAIPSESDTDTLELGPDGMPINKRSRHSLYIILFIVFILSGLFVALFHSGFNSAEIQTNASSNAAAVLIKNPEIVKKIDMAEKLVHADRFEEAAELFEEVMAATPAVKEKVVPMYSRALRGMASGLIKPDSDRAKALLLKSVALDPDNAQGHYLLGRLYAEQKDTVSAVTLYQRAIELDPKMTNAFFNLGYIYAEKRDYINAREMYIRVVELSPPYLDEALFNLAVVQIKLKDTEVGIKNLEKALTVNPENKQARKMLEKIQTKG